MFPAKFNHPVKEIELTFECVNVELIKVSSMNFITAETNEI